MPAQLVSLATYATLGAAIAAISATGGEIDAPPGDYSVSGATTVPANIGLTLHPGTALIASNNATLTINGPFSAPRSKVFYGFASKTISFANSHVVIPEWWGVRDGTNRDDIAINEAIFAGRSIGLSGDYSLGDKIIIPYAGVNGARKCLFGVGGKAVLYASTANKTLLHLADSHAIVRNLSLWANAQGITLFKVMPELEAANTAVANQNYNLVENIDLNGGDEGLILMAGREIGGTASGCWYNRFLNMRWSSNKRALLLRDNGSTSIISSGSNCNTFEGEMNGSINTGVQIDAGGGNRFRLQMENINLGTSPSPIPTGIIIVDQMVNGGDNPNNVFHDWHGENLTRHATINEPLTRFYNGDLDFTKVAGAAANTFFDDRRGSSGSGSVATWNASVRPTSGGTITLNQYNQGKWSQVGKVVTVSAYLQVASVSGAPANVVHIDGLPKPAASGTPGRAICAVLSNNMNTGGGATTIIGRILEGSTTLDVFGWANNNLTYLAPHVKALTDFNFTISYLTD